MVGAGLSGLTAARKLVDAGVEVLVLEARERVGGRTWSQEIGDGRFDMGAQWIGPNQNRLAALASELGVATFPTFHRGRKVLDLAGRVSTYKGTIPSLGWLNLVLLQLGLTRLDKMTKRVPLDKPWEAADAEALDSMTVDTWRARALSTAPVRAVFDVAVRTVFGAEPAELSLLHFLFYLNSGGGLMSLVEVENGAQQDRFLGGAQQLALRLADLLGDRLVLSAPARGVEHDEDGVRVHTDQGTYEGRYAIVAVPPHLAERVRWEPSMAVQRAQLTQRVPMGYTTKVHLLYDTIFWRDAGFSGEAVCTGGPLTFCVDNTDELCGPDAVGTQPALLGFIVGARARDWGARPAEERKAAVLGQLQRYFGDAAGTPTHYVEQDWATEPWTGGCPASAMGPGVMTTLGKALREPCGRIHWAGTETATDWNGYMEGALEAGERAADEVLAEL